MKQYHFADVDALQDVRLRFKDRLADVVLIHLDLLAVRHAGVLARELLLRRGLHRERDEPLLGAVVQVPLKPLPLLPPRVDDPRARSARRRAWAARMPVAVRRNTRSAWAAAAALSLAFARCTFVARRAVQLLHDDAPQGIDLGEALHLVAEELDARGQLGVVAFSCR